MRAVIGVSVSPMEYGVAQRAGHMNVSQGVRLALQFAHENWPAFREWMVSQGLQPPHPIEPSDER